MVKAIPDDVPPPGAGVLTVTCAIPAAVTSVPETAAFNSVGPT
jgi:hypothetical protein